MQQTREIYWNIGGGDLLYPLAAVAGVCLALGLWRRIRLIRLGGPAHRLDRLGERLAGTLKQVLGQRRLLRDPWAGAAHLLIVYGLLAQLVATGLIAIQEWSGLALLRGGFYLAYSLVSDVAGILAVTGLCIALWRRAIVRPARLSSTLDDWITLALLLLLFLQGFAVEGLRIAATEWLGDPGLAHWSPGGRLVALGLDGAGVDSLRRLHRAAWWIHAVTALGFIAYLIRSSLSHVFFGVASIFTRDLDSGARLTFPDIEEMLEREPEALETLGAGRIDELSWKDLLDLQACVDCGRCQEVCPATLSGVPLNPRRLIQQMREHLDAVGPGLLSQGNAGPDSAPPAESPALFGPGLPGEAAPALLDDEIWGCRTCGACARECPVHVEHVPKIVAMRRYLVMTEARMGDPTEAFLRSMDERRHPYEGTAHDRESGLRDLGVRVLAPGDSAEVLFWIGCSGSLVDRNIAVTRAMVRILDAAGVDFGVLGGDEVCCGDPARRVGAELSYQTCVRQNIDRFESRGFRKILTTCPHCMNALGREYPDFGGRYEVVHHTELIRDLLASGRLRLSRDLDSVTYHDPCYLGRHNGVYDAPREVLDAATAAGGRHELEASRSRSLCCGAGGGHAWMDDAARTRIHHIRFEQIRSCGARNAAVACPFCMQLLEDASGALDPERRVRVADIAELVAEALADAPVRPGAPGSTPDSTLDSTLDSDTEREREREREGRSVE